MTYQNWLDDRTMTERVIEEGIIPILPEVQKQEAEEKARKEEYAREVARGPGICPVYKAPTFEEVSAGMKKAWDEVERIMPSAPEAAKSYAFQTLVHAQAAAMTGFPGA